MPTATGQRAARPREVTLGSQESGHLELSALWLRDNLYQERWEVGSEHISPGSHRPSLEF